MTDPTPPPLTITTGALPNATVGVAYSATLAASGGTAPYAWSLAPGATLPAWLTLTADGTLSGTPDVTGNVDTVMEVADASVPAQVVDSALGFSVHQPPCGYIWTAYGLIQGTIIWGDTEHVCGGPTGHDTMHLCGCGVTAQLELPPATPPLCPEA